MTNTQLFARVFVYLSNGNGFERLKLSERLEMQNFFGFCIGRYSLLNNGSKNKSYIIISDAIIINQEAILKYNQSIIFTCYS